MTQITVKVPPEKVAELVREHVRGEHPSLAAWNDAVQVDRRGAIVTFTKAEDADVPNP